MLTVSEQGREYHSWRHPEDDDDGKGKPQKTLKDPPSMHLRDDMAKRRVKTFDGVRVLECALTWQEFESKYGPGSNHSS